MATIIKSPARNIFICGTRPTEADIFPPPLPPPPVPEKVFALKMDGVNDYLQPASYTQWERTQPFTMQFFLSARTANGFLFENRQNIGGQSRGIAIFTNGSVFQILLNHNNTNRYVKTVVANPAALHLAATWDGTQGFYYENGILANTTTGVNVSALTATIINTANFFRLFGRADLTLGTLSPFGGTLKNFSVVNYAKSAAEIATDYAAGFQSAGTGAYLLAYDFNVPEDEQALTIVADTGPNLSIFGQTAPGDWVCIENC